MVEGWRRTRTAPSEWFGYLNRNYEERLNIPVGPKNGFNGEDMARPKVSSRPLAIRIKGRGPSQLSEGS